MQTGTHNIAEGPAMAYDTAVKAIETGIEIADIFAEICVEVGLPKGILNVIHGRGSVVGNRLASNPKVGLVSLTGSLTAGQEVMKAAAENITNVSLELGGKAPAIVFKDADLSLAAKAIVASRVINSGQVCNCAERVYVHEDVKAEFEKLLFAELDKVKFGYVEDQIIIKNFTSDVKKGEMVAIVGPTGAGKTTMVKLLMRFYDINGGNIYIDGKDISKLDRFLVKSPTPSIDI